MFAAGALLLLESGRAVKAVSPEGWLSADGMPRLAVFFMNPTRFFLSGLKRVKPRNYT